FSRHADLGPTARYLYPIWGITGAILSSIELLQFHRGGAQPPAAKVPLAAAALLSIGGLLVTIKAASNMLRVRHLDNNEAALQEAFDGFELWGGIRGLLQVLAFPVSFWSLLAILTPTARPGSE